LIVVFDMPPPLFPVIRIERRFESDSFGTALDPISTDRSVLSFYGTSSTSRRPLESARSIGSPWRVYTASSMIDRVLDVTAGLSVPLDVPGQLSEIKRLTGYGWEQLAIFLGCTRQAVYRWTLGDSITDPNRGRLAKLHATIRFIDRGSAEDNRALLDTATDGQTLADMLSQGSFEEVRALAGRGSGRQDAKWGRLGREEFAPEDHWYFRLVQGGDVDGDAVVRAKPQIIKPLRLSKG
jgi:hypothetical protein